MWGLGKSLVNVFVLAKHESPCMNGVSVKASLIISKCKSLHSILFISDTISDTLQSFSGGFGKCQDPAATRRPIFPSEQSSTLKLRSWGAKWPLEATGKVATRTAFRTLRDPLVLSAPKVMVDWLVISRYDDRMMHLWLYHSIFMIELCIYRSLDSLCQTWVL